MHFFFEYETIVRSSTWSFDHSDPDPRSVFQLINQYLFFAGEEIGHFIQPQNQASIATSQVSSGNHDWPRLSSTASTSNGKVLSFLEVCFDLNSSPLLSMKIQSQSLLRKVKKRFFFFLFLFKFCTQNWISQNLATF